MKRRIVSLLMCFVMTFGMLPTAAWAELIPAQGETEEAASNTAYGVGEDTAVQSGEDGIAVLAASENEAEYNGVEYATLVDAFKAAADAGGTVTVLKDLTLNKEDGTGIAVTYAVTLDLNGCKIEKANYADADNAPYWTYSVFLVQSGGNLTIMDSVGKGEVVQPNTKPVVTVDDGGTLTVNSGTLKATNAGGGTNFDTYTMNCALNVCGGTAYINGGSFSGGQWCVSVVSGSNGSGHLYVAGGEFHGAASYALLVQHGGEAQLPGGTYTTTKGEYSIHHSSSSGKVNGLLASNYQYVNEKDEAATISDDQRGVVGNAKVVPKDGVVEYIGEGGTTQVRTDATELTGGNNILNDEWYVVTGNVTINDSLTISRPTVNLILCDKATLTVDILEVYSVFEQATLNVYLQKDGTGTLTTPLGTPPGDERELIIKSPGTPMKIVDDEGNKVTNIKDITEGGFTVSKCEHEGIVYNTQTPTGHEGTCDYCGTTVSGKHSFGAWEQNDADTHKAICTVCKFEKPAEHDFELSALEDGQHHSVTCRTCNYQGAAAAHTYAENTKDYYNRLTCTGCGVFLAAEYNGGAVCPVTGGYRRGQG